MTKQIPNEVAEAILKLKSFCSNYPSCEGCPFFSNQIEDFCIINNPHAWKRPIKKDQPTYYIEVEN